MKKSWYCLLVLFVFVVFFSGQVCAYENGDIMTTFKGVSAKSNGDGKMPSEYGQYQCVEYVKRFYREAYGINLYEVINVARNYYLKYDDSNYAYIKNSGLVRYTNKDYFYPQPGDIIVYNNSNGIGHVGIATSSSATQINTVEQNWSTNGIAILSANNLGGSYAIADRGTYPILGLLHMPVGEFSDGWHFDSDRQYSNIYHNLKNSRPFTVSYKNNGGRAVLGLPTGKVYEFPNWSNPYTFGSYSNMRKAWVQDFQNGNDAYSLVVNEHVINIDKGYFGVAYPIGGQIRIYWQNNYWELGYPVSNEYFYNPNSLSPPEFTVQWFERLDEEYHVVIYNNHTDQALHESKSTTSIPLPDLSKFREQASSFSFVPEGIGGGGSVVAKDYELYSSDFYETVANEEPLGGIGLKTVFYNKDSFVYYAIELRDVYTSVNVEQKWYDSDGTNVFNWTEITEHPSAKGHLYWDTYDVWSWHDISSANQYGRWRVDLYLDNVKAKTDYFTLAIALTAPTNITATVDDNAQVNITWQVSLNALSYRIFRNGTRIAETNNTSFLDMYVQEDETYNYQVQAVNGTSTSSLSKLISITVIVATEPEPVAPNTVPNAVKGLIITPD